MYTVYETQFKENQIHIPAETSEPQIHKWTWIILLNKMNYLCFIPIFAPDPMASHIYQECNGMMQWSVYVYYIQKKALFLSTNLLFHKK